MQIYHETFLEFENKDVWKPMSDLQLIIKYENDIVYVIDDRDNREGAMA